jgi:hypothetical protein
MKMDLFYGVTIHASYAVLRSYSIGNIRYRSIWEYREFRGILGLTLAIRSERTPVRCAMYVAYYASMVNHMVKNRPIL